MDLEFGTVRHTKTSSGTTIDIESSHNFVHQSGVRRVDDGFDTRDYTARRQFFKQHSLVVDHSELARLSPRPSFDQVVLSNTRVSKQANASDIYNERRVWYHNNRNTVGISSITTPMPVSNSIVALLLLIFSTVFGMCTWFSAGAVLPQLKILYNITETQGSLLTLAVNFGFLIGALLSVVLKLADKVSPSTLMTVGSAVAALFNVGMLLPNCAFGGAIVLRIGTGMAMALVYPMACKVAASWFVENRGLAIGFVVGSVGLGSSSPHLVNVFFSDMKWYNVLIVCSILSTIASIVSLCFLTEGPHLRVNNNKKKEEEIDEIAVEMKNNDGDGSSSSSSSSQDAFDIKLIVQNSAFWWSTLGYCGHNWELYALWLWFKKFAFDYNVGELLWKSDPTRGASLCAFLVVSSSMIGSGGAGLIADRLGRTTVCLCALSVSILGSLLIGLHKDSPIYTMVIGLFWGICAVAESAQYSAMTSEVVDKSVVGNAVTIQFGKPCLMNY
jgi:MFS family permease